MSNEKPKYKHPANHVGYIKKSKAGNVILVVENDIQLSAGDQLIQQKPQDILKGLLDREVITEEKYNQRMASTPDWKLYEVKKMEFKD